MRAQRYGALPVARRVGGLNDTIKDDATGFLFDPYRADAFESALSRAVTAFHHRTRWEQLVRQAMRLDHSWAPSARRYQSAYQRAIHRRRERA
jgi:starch synthase